MLLASRGMTPEPEDIEGIVNQLNDLPAHADVKEGWRGFRPAAFAWWR